MYQKADFIFLNFRNTAVHKQQKTGNNAHPMFSGTLTRPNRQILLESIGGRKCPPNVLEKFTQKQKQTFRASLCARTPMYCYKFTCVSLSSSM
jgi:hypothetical protein